MPKIYLDYAAATPLDPRVARTMRPFFSSQFGNPSSTHAFGRKARASVDTARAQVASVLHCGTHEIIFTHSGTESNNLAILGIARGNMHRGKHIVTTQIEHDSVLKPVRQLEKEGFQVTYLKPDQNGLIDPRQLRGALRKDTVLVSIIIANNEIGTVQDIPQLIASVRSYSKNILFHTDACQYVGSFRLDLSQLDIDALTCNASKIYGPKGAGILFLRESTACEPLIFGGGHEKGFWSGTENVMAIVGCARALSIAQQTYKRESVRLKNLRVFLWRGIQKNIRGVSLNGHPLSRLPQNLHVSFEGMDTETLLIALDRSGIFVSSGSACLSGSLEPSYVLEAVGKQHIASQAHIRFTLGRWTKKTEIQAAIRILIRVVRFLRGREKLF